MEPYFKGELSSFISLGSRINTDTLVPSLPTSRVGHTRQRVEETPTHTGGLSESARQKLEERRKHRDKQRGMSLI